MQTPSEQFGDFIQQLPLGPFITVCGATLLLMLFVFWIGYLKPKRKQDRETNTTDESVTMNESNDSGMMPGNVPYADIQRTVNEPVLATDGTGAAIEDDDLPDLNALLDTSGLVKELPNVQPTVKPDNTKAQTSKPVSVQSSVPVVRPQQDQVIELHTGHRIPAKEIVAVLRDPRDGRLVVQIDEVGYRSLVDSPEAKQKFVKIMRELSTVVTEPDENPPMDDEPIPAAQVPPVDDTPTILDQRDAPSVIEKPKSAKPLPASTDGVMPGDLPTYKLEDSVQPQRGGLFGGRPKYEAQPIPELDIAAAIEAYLQHKLSYSSEYAGREIHVHSAPGGGVRIQVDDAFYEAVGDVADPEIRSFLADTIQEWQDRQ